MKAMESNSGMVRARNRGVHIIRKIENFNRPESVHQRRTNTMKTTLYAMVLSAALSTMALAADFSGTLVDATCADQKQQTKAESCNASSATTTFAINVAGKMYKLDAEGNSKAAKAVRDRADRSSDPAKALTTPLTAKVSGTEKEGVITVESIDVQ
jgi:hypothetical protein